MAVNTYKVIQTTDIGHYERTLYWAMPSVVKSVYGRFIMFAGLNAAIAEAGGDNLAGMYWLSNPACYSLAISLGVKAINISDLYVGERFYFGDDSYIRISNISHSGTTYVTYSVTYQFYKNSALVGTYTRDGIWADALVPFFPFKFLGNTTQNCDSFAIRAFTNNGVDYLEWYMGPGSSGNYTWLITYYDDFTPVDTDNPYEPGGTSETGGGENGNFSEDSDDVEEDSMPTLSAVGTGMATIFNPSVTQLKNLSNVFWGSNWWQALQNSVEGIDKMFISLGIVPFDVTAGSTVEVTWLGLSITEVYLTLAAQQYYEFDMGTIDLGNDSRIFTSDSALDYSPFSKLGIYLPFIGYQELDIDECRGATVQLKYRVDILSGTCVALVKVAGNTIYQFTGNCITQIPITSQSFENLFTNAVNVGIAWGNARNAGAIAGGGDAGDIITPDANMRFPLPEVAGGGEIGAQSRLGNATANAMMGLKPTFNKTGSVSASATLFTVKQPFLFLTTPRQCLPSHYQRYCGFPSNITGNLNEFSGLTVVESIRLNNLVATATEVQEIYDLLHKGVII